MKILRTLLSAKKIALVLLVAVFTLTLVACGKSSGTPYGSLSDKAYLTTNGYTVTEKQLYDQLRTSSVNRLITYIDELVFADVKIDAADLSDFEVSAFEQEINTALFSSATITPTQISTYSERMIAQTILSYADSFAITNPGVDKNLLIEFLDTVIQNVISEAPNYDESEDFVFGYVQSIENGKFDAVIASLIKQYNLAVQKKVYAKELLGDIVKEGDNWVATKELADEDSSVYISEANIVTQYKNSIAGKYSTSALVVSFDSVLEGELARYKFAVKSNARGQWFRIPNIADEAVFAAIKDNPTDPTLIKAAEVLTTKLNINIAVLDKIEFDSEDFAKYYSNYSIGTEDEPLDDRSTNNEVLQVFLQMYDYLNGTTYADVAIADLAAGTEHRIQMETDFEREYANKVLASNTALRTYIYGLDNEALYYSTINAPIDGKTYGRPYSRQIQSFNNSQYLVYLLDDNRDEDKDVLDETDSENIVFQTNENAIEQRRRALEQLVDARFTSSYVSTKVNEKYEDLTVNIYDPILRDFYANSKDYNGSKGFLDNNTLVKIEGENFEQVITVDAFFAEVTKTMGLSTALDNLLVQKLRAEYETQITDKDKATYKENLEEILKSFQAGGFESNGFPASVGVDKFLLLAIGAYAHDGMSATQDAMDKMYVQPKLRELFEADLTKHYGDQTPENNIYAQFAQLASKQRSNEIEIAADHLLIYVDFNNDGTPDNPTNELIQDQNFKDIETLEDFEAFVLELAAIISARAKQSPSLKTGLQNVATAYTNATRFSKFQTEQGYLDFIENATAEEILDFIRKAKDSDVFGTFKRLGLKVKYESLGSITNKTNFPGGSSSLDVDFFNYAMALGKHIQAEVATQDEPKPAELLPLFAPDLLANTESVNDDAEFTTDNIRSAFGWHLILVTDYTLPLSAKVTGNESDYESTIANPFVTGEKLNGYNESDVLTWEQILIHIEEAKEFEGDVVTLPTNVQSAYSKYYTPVQTQFASSYQQLEISFNYLFDGNISLANVNPALDTQLQALRAANFNQFFSYSHFDASILNDEANAEIVHLYEAAINNEYSSVFGEWFNILK